MTMSDAEGPGSVDLSLATLDQIVMELHSRFSTVVVLTCDTKESGSQGTSIRFIGNVTAALGLCITAQNAMLNSRTNLSGE